MSHLSLWYQRLHMPTVRTPSESCWIIGTPTKPTIIGVCVEHIFWFVVAAHLSSPVISFNFTCKREKSLIGGARSQIIIFLFAGPDVPTAHNTAYFALRYFIMLVKSGGFIVSYCSAADADNPVGLVVTGMAIASFHHSPQNQLPNATAPL